MITFTSRSMTNWKQIIQFCILLRTLVAVNILYLEIKFEHLVWNLSAQLVKCHAVVVDPCYRRVVLSLFRMSSIKRLFFQIIFFTNKKIGNTFSENSSILQKLPRSKISGSETGIVKICNYLRFRLQTLTKHSWLHFVRQCQNFCFCYKEGHDFANWVAK